MGSFPLSALSHSFIFFLFVPGTFLSPPCLPWPWGQLAGRDAGLSPRSQDNGPAGTRATTVCWQLSGGTELRAWGCLSSWPGREGAQAQRWVGEWEVLHPGSSGCFAYPALRLTCLFPHLFPQLELVLWVGGLEESGAGAALGVLTACPSLLGMDGFSDHPPAEGPAPKSTFWGDIHHIVKGYSSAAQLSRVISALKAKIIWRDCPSAELCEMCKKYLPPEWR